MKKYFQKKETFVTFDLKESALAILREGLRIGKEINLEQKDNPNSPYNYSFLLEEIDGNPTYFITVKDSGNKIEVPHFNYCLLKGFFDQYISDEDFSLFDYSKQDELIRIACNPFRLESKLRTLTLDRKYLTDAEQYSASKNPIQYVLAGDVSFYNNPLQSDALFNGYLTPVLHWVGRNNREAYSIDFGEEPSYRRINNILPKSSSLISRQILTESPHTFGWAISFIQKGYLDTISPDILFFAQWNDPSGVKELLEIMSDREALLAAQSLINPAYLEKVSPKYEVPAYIQTQENGKYFPAMSHIDLTDYQFERARLKSVRDFNPFDDGSS